MTEEEFNLIDDLYFVTSYKSLAEEAGLKEELLKELLWQLIQKQWVRCLSNPEHEIWPDKKGFDENFTEYHYLATKQGLILHNER